MTASKIHWFFTMGNAPRQAVYARPGSDAAEHEFVTPALLAMGWPVPKSEFDRLELHLLPTKELLVPASALATELGQQHPLLAGKLDPTRHAVLEKRDVDAIWKVVAVVLTEVKDGDDVVIELTNGLRSITTGFLLASGLLLAARPKVRVRAVTYAELDSAKPPAGITTPEAPRARGEIHDLLPFLQLFKWSQAVHAMATYLDPSPTIALVQEAQGSGDASNIDEDSPLFELAEALAFNQPVRIEQALRAWSELRHTVASTTPAARISLEQVDRTLAALEVPQGERDVLTLEHLRFDLSLAERFAAASRLADALRTLRELFVNAVIVAREQGAEWKDMKKRHNAEFALTGISPKGSAPSAAVGPVWDRISKLRNAASHLGYNKNHEALEEQKVLDELLGITRQMREWLAEPQLERFKLPQREPKGYLGNAFSLNMLAPMDNGDTLPVQVQRLSANKARELSTGLTSCVGHVDTAAVMSTVLGRTVECNRTTVELQRGDFMIVGQFRGDRLEAGATTLPPGAKIEWMRVTVG